MRRIIIILMAIILVSSFISCASESSKNGNVDEDTLQKSSEVSTKRELETLETSATPDTAAASSEADKKSESEVQINADTSSKEDSSAAVSENKTSNESTENNSQNVGISLSEEEKQELVLLATEMISRVEIPEKLNPEDYEISVHSEASFATVSVWAVNRQDPLDWQRWSYAVDESGNFSLVRGVYSEAFATKSRLVDFRSLPLEVIDEVEAALEAKQAEYEKEYGPIEHYLACIYWRMWKTEETIELRAILNFEDPASVAKTIETGDFWIRDIFDIQTVLSVPNPVPGDISIVWNY